MLHRHFVDGEWKACQPTDVFHQPDSRVHRYDREIGFKSSDEEAAMIQADARLAAAERRSRKRSKQDSHAQVVRRWAWFERYLLEFHPEDSYTIYLRSLELAAVDEAGEYEHFYFKAPPALLLLAYVMKLRGEDERGEDAEVPERKKNSIRALTVSTISSVLKEFRYQGFNPGRDQRVAQQMKSYDEDKTKQAMAFDVETKLPKMWTVLWELNGWNHHKRLCAWAMLLVGMCICARGSCLTQFCPLLEDIEWPPARHWDGDGLPKYITIYFK